MGNIKAILNNRIKDFEMRVDKGLSTIEQYASFKGDEILKWLDLKNEKPNKNDAGHLRRLMYVHHRVSETLDRLSKKDIADTEFPLGKRKLKDIKALCNKYEQSLKSWIGKNKDIDLNKTVRFNVASVVRCLKADSELGPLLVSSLDSQLFAACYALRYFNHNLLPEERSLLYKRIWKEMQLYVTKNLTYHDLSTLWWGANIITKDWGEAKFEDDAPELEKKIEMVHNLLRLPVIKSTNDKIPEEIYLTEEGRHQISYDRNGDLVTLHRSLVFCYQNAVEVRAWIKDRRNPRLLPLIDKIRRWADLCAKNLLKIKKKDRKRLYDTALDLAFCVDWWKDRVSFWKESVNILDNGITKNDYKDKSHVEGIATTDLEYAQNLNKVVKSTVPNFRKSSNQKRPLVIALFGPPGTGKSAVAKASNAKGNNLIELNLSVYETPKELFTTLSHQLEIRKIPKPILFLDEFDTTMRNEYWYHWILTLLWDGEFPVVDKSDFVNMKPIPSSSVVFLAASRYEKYEDFRDFALSLEARNHKAADLLTRIDLYIDIPSLTPADRSLVMASIPKKYGGSADYDVLALCYLAELEDNARGIAKLIKGVNLTRKFGLSDLIPTTKERLLETAAISFPDEI